MGRGSTYVSVWILLLLCIKYEVHSSWSMNEEGNIHHRSETHAIGRDEINPHDSDSQWENHGNGLLNQRRAKCTRITNRTVADLQLRWAFVTGGDVSATPAIADGVVYFPAWNGMLYALDEHTGALLWSTDLLQLAGGVASNGSRATPTVWKDLLLIGMMGPASVAAINRHDGTVRWMSRLLDTTAFSVITMSGTAYDGYIFRIQLSLEFIDSAKSRVHRIHYPKLNLYAEFMFNRFFYVGTSSLEETNTCCAFQGSFSKINITDGSVVWRTRMLPPDSGYFGAAIWGSSPSIDPGKRLVFIATGNNYRVPESVEACEAERSRNSSISKDTCLDAGNHMDSMLALNIDDGSIVWSRNLLAYDAWTSVCQASPTTPNCPDVLGPDYDFGEAPMIIYLDDAHPSHSRRNGKLCIVVAGQKSGFVWALDCDTGSIVWSTAAGPGSALGGAIWGSCSDGKRVYTNIGNVFHSDFILAPSNEVTNASGWVAMDAATGKVLWSKGEPTGGYSLGPLSVSNGVVFVTSLTEGGDIYALDALTGAVLWHNTTGAGIYGGVSISRSCIFVGNGYHKLFQYEGIGVRAFCLPDDG